MKALIEKFDAYLAVEKNASVHTRKSYTRDLRQFEGFLKGYPKLKPKPKRLKRFRRKPVRGPYEGIHREEAFYLEELFQVPGERGHH
jgi:site-specific recombinase XerC